MQAMVLEKACIQCGLCAGLCPEVFALNSGEPARVTVDPIPDAQKIGESSAILGAGRKTKDDTIDFAAGIVLKEKTGAKVEQGQTLAVLHTNRPETLADAERVFLEAIRWGTDAPEAQPLIYGIVK